LFAEEDEEVPIARHEALQKSGHVICSPLRSKSVEGQVYRTREKGARKEGGRRGERAGQEKGKVRRGEKALEMGMRKL